LGCFAAPAWAIPEIQHGSAGCTAGPNRNTATFFASNLTVGNIVICSVGISGSASDATPTVSSISLGTDTLTLIPGNKTAVGTTTTYTDNELWSTTVATASQKAVNITTSAGTAANVQAVCGEFDGDMYSLTVDTTAGTQATCSSGGSCTTTVATTALTTTNANDIIIASQSANFGTGFGMPATSSLANHGANGTGGAGNEETSLSSQIANTVQSSLTLSGTLGAANNWVTNITSLKRNIGLVQTLGVGNTGTGLTASGNFGNSFSSGNIVFCAIALCGDVDNPSPIVSTVVIGSGGSTDSLAQVSSGSVTNGTGATGVDIELWTGTIAGSAGQTAIAITASVNGGSGANVNTQAACATYKGITYTHTLDPMATPVASRTGSASAVASSASYTATSNAKDLIILASGCQQAGSCMNTALNAWTGANGIGGYVQEVTKNHAGGGAGNDATGAVLATLVDHPATATHTFSASNSATSTPNWGNLIAAFQQAVPSQASGFIFLP